MTVGHMSVIEETPVRVVAALILLEVAFAESAVLAVIVLPTAPVIVKSSFSVSAFAAGVPAAGCIDTVTDINIGPLFRRGYR